MLSSGQKWSLIGFNLLYIAAFAAYYLLIRNYEFLWYVAVMLFLFSLFLLSINYLRFPPFVLWGLSLWGLLHMAGGGVKIGGDVLYQLHLVPIAGSGELFVLKYDQAVHAYGFAIATFAVYYLLKPYLNEKTNWTVTYPILVVAGMGLGALNEIVEFMPVLVVGNTGVGGYFNTALDLVFNTFGAIVAVWIIHFLRTNEGKRS